MKRWPLIVAFVVVFLAGIIVGGAASFHFARKMFLVVPKAEKIAEMMLSKARRDFDLTPEQVAKAHPIIERQAREMVAAHRTMNAQMVEALEKSAEELKALLSPEQQVLLEKRREQWRRDFNPAP